MDANEAKNTGFNLQGNYPIFPTCFKPDGSLDKKNIENVIAYLVQSKVDGFTILANASEGFALSDYEKDYLIEFILQETNGRLPVVVTVNHYSSKIAVEKSKKAVASGAAAVMSMPPFWGTSSPESQGIFGYFQIIAEAVDVPVIIQDDPVLSGVNLSVDFLEEMVANIAGLNYVKLECPQSPGKIGAIKERLGNNIRCFGGAGGITYINELERGACGTMASAALLELGEVYKHFVEGDLEKARSIYYNILPLIVFELFMAPRHFTKEVLKKAGIVENSNARCPYPSYDEKTQVQLEKLLADIKLRVFNVSV